jgi:SAM-dependent methyltransferase
MNTTEDIENKSDVFITPTTWITRACPVCGESSNLQAVGERTYHVPTRTGNYLLHHKDAQCQCCGLVFTASVPDEEFLSIYYTNAHTQRSDITDIPPIYNTQTRLARLHQHITLGSEILEIGASGGQFLQALNQAGYNAVGLDPLLDSAGKPAAGLFSGKDLNRFAETRKFDAVLSYYVLEHVSNPRQWLCDLRKFLRPSGHVIIEVPNFEHYPAESLYKEHLQHFTRTHLVQRYIDLLVVRMRLSVSA